MSYAAMMKIFKWNAGKNEILAKKREITLKKIVQRINSGAKVTEIEHPIKHSLEVC